MKACGTLLFSLLIFFAVSLSAAEGPQTFTLDGRIKQAGIATPVTDPSVRIVIHVMDPNRQCVLYAEEQFVNTQTSNGYFNIAVGSSTGAGKRIAGVDPGLPMATVFSNNAAMAATNVSGQTCPQVMGVPTYTPTTKDSRYFRIFVTPSLTGVTDTLTDVVLDAVPTAMVAQSAESANAVGGFAASDLLKVNTAGGHVLNQTNLDTVFTTSNYSVLTGLLAGTSLLYNRPASNGTNVLPSIAAPTSPTAGQVWYNSGNILYHDGTTTRTISTGSSSSVSATDGSAATPSIGFSSDTDTGWYLAAPDNLAAATGGVERARINENGNFGIGVISPGARLSLGGNATAAAWGSAGIGIRQNNATYTDSSSSGTVGFNYVNAFGIPTLAASAATTYTNASNFSLYPPVPGANVTLTNSTGLTVNASTLTGVTNGYGLQVNAPTGATNNYAATFNGGNVGVGTTAPLTLLSLNANATGPVTPNANSLLQLTGADNSAVASTIDAFGSSVNWQAPYFTLRRARGTSAAPLPVQNTDMLGQIQFMGYETGFNGGSYFGVNATENWTPTAKGSEFYFQFTKTGGTSSLTARMAKKGFGVNLANTQVDSLLTAGGNQSNSSWTTTGSNFSIQAGTSTDTSGSGTIATRTSSSFAVPTFASSSAVTLTNAANVYIAGAPAAGANTSFTNSQAFHVASGISYFGGNVGMGTTTPTATLHLKTGTAAAGTAPLKLTAGVNLTTPEAGAIEFDGTSLFYTDSGNIRRTLGVAGAGITALTGEVTASGSGSVAATIADNAITNAKMADNAVNTAELADDAVAFSKLQNIATQKLIGRSTALTGDAEELGVGTGLTITGGNLNLVDTTDDDSFTTLLGVCANGYVPHKLAGAWTCIEATDLLVNSSLVKRGATGNFAANVATFNGVKLNNAGSEVTITNPIGAAYNLTLPVDDGTAGQVLQTDGSGVLSWVTSLVSGGTGLFVNGTAAAPSISFTNDPNTGFFNPSNDSNVIATSTDGVERMRVDATGNVGIGTTSPSAGGTSANAGRNYLTIKGSSNSGVIQLTSSAADADGVHQGNVEWVDSNSVSADKRIAYISTLLSGATANNRGSFMAFGTRDDAGSSTSERFRITNTGNIAVGTVTAGARLDVRGSTSDSSALAFKARNSSNTDLFVIRNDGNVGIGTTAPNANAKLEVSGTIANTVSTFSAAFTCGTSSLDFSSGNLKRLSPSNTIASGTCGVALQNLAPGASYTLVVTGTAATNSITYNFTGYTFKYLPTNAPTTPGYDTIYNFLYDGTTVYVTWAGGY